MFIDGCMEGAENRRKVYQHIVDLQALLWYGRTVVASRIIGMDSIFGESKSCLAAYSKVLRKCYENNKKVVDVKVMLWYVLSRQSWLHERDEKMAWKWWKVIDLNAILWYEPFRSLLLLLEEALVLSVRSTVGSWGHEKDPMEQSFAREVCLLGCFWWLQAFWWPLMGWRHFQWNTGGGINPLRGFYPPPVFHWKCLLLIVGQGEGG